MGSPEAPQIVVVGAGMGGLSAALSLAARGARVRVLEAGPRIGGKVDIFTHEGVTMDTGPSLLTLPDVLDRVFRAAGTSLADELTLFEPTPAFRYRFPGDVVFDVFPALADTIDSARRAFGAEAASQLERFLSYARAIWDASRDTFVLGPAPRPFDLPLLFAKNPRSLTRVDPFRSMSDAIDAEVREPRLRDVLLRYATYNGSSPYLAPATLNCIAHVEMGLGMYGVKGGMHEIARALRRCGERLGVEYHLDMPVERVLLRGRRVVGVRTQGGQEWPAAAVVVNADVAHLADTLLPEVKRALPKPGTPSLSGVCLLLKAPRLPDRVAHEVIFPERYASEFEDLFDAQRAPMTPTLYLCAQERAHARAGWDEHEPVFVMANAPPRSLHDDKADDEDAQGLVDRMTSSLQAQGWIESAGDVVWQRTPRGLAERFSGSRGSIYGAASHGWGAAFQRPSNEVRAHPGLFLASGTAHPGGGVPLCVQSGAMAAERCASALGLS